jgi:hypothetical protein
MSRPTKASSLSLHFIYSYYCDSFVPFYNDDVMWEPSPLPGFGMKMEPVKRRLTRKYFPEFDPFSP